MYEQEEDIDVCAPQYLTFAVDQLCYGIDIACVTEIVGLHQIAPIPDTSPEIRGVINLRGKVIPVMDVRLRFKLDTIPYTARTCIIVLRVLDGEVGLIVDRVHEVVSISETDVEPPPSIERSGMVACIMGMAKIDGAVTVLLDAETLLYGSSAAAA